VVERSEYFARQETLRALAVEHGYAGVLAWSRGGGGQDRYADVYYLTGFYTHQPFVPDLASKAEADSEWRWRAAGHAAVVIPSEGPVTLVVDSAYLQDPQPVADEVVVSADLIRTVSDLLAATEGGEGHRRRRPKFALLGGDALPARWARELEVYLEARLGGAEIFEADELGWRLRRRGLPDSTMGGAWGHGLGLSFEPPWIHADSEQSAEPGMCLAVERRIEAPGLGGAQYEDDVLVVEGGAELLTLPRSATSTARSDRVSSLGAASVRRPRRAFWMERRRGATGSLSIGAGRHRTPCGPRPA
jgi:Xaa-Pro aminopeptidase